MAQFIRSFDPQIRKTVLFEVGTDGIARSTASSTAFRYTPGQ